MTAIEKAAKAGKARVEAAKAREAAREAAANNVKKAEEAEKVAMEEAAVARAKAMEGMDEAVARADAVIQALDKVSRAEKARAEEVRGEDGRGVANRAKKVDYNVIDALNILKKKIKQFIPHIEEIQNEDLENKIKTFLKKCKHIRILNINERTNLQSMILSITDHKIKIVAIAGYILPSKLSGKELLDKVFEMIKEESKESKDTKQFQNTRNKFNNNLKLVKRLQKDPEIIPGNWGNKDILKELLQQLYNIKFKIDDVKTNKSTNTDDISECSIIINDYQLLHRNIMNIKNYFTSNNKIILNNGSTLYDIDIIDKKLAKKYNIKYDKLKQYDKNIENFGILCIEYQNSIHSQIGGDTNDDLLNNAESEVKKLLEKSSEVINQVNNNLQHKVGNIKEQINVFNFNKKIDEIIDTLYHNDRFNLDKDRYNNLEYSKENKFIEKYINVYCEYIENKKNFTFIELIDKVLEIESN